MERKLVDSFLDLISILFWLELGVQLQTLRLYSRS